MNSILISMVILSYGIIFFVKNCTATIDLSNVNLMDFKYFKNKPTADDDNNNGHLKLLTDKLAKHQNIKDNLVQTILGKITDKYEKAKSVATYFKNVLIGNPDDEIIHTIKIDPHSGKLWKSHYEYYYGPKGQYLIESLGNGYHPSIYHRYISSPSSSSLHHYDTISHNHYYHDFDEHF